MKKATPRKSAAAKSRHASASPSFNQNLSARFANLKKTFNVKMDQAVKSVKAQDVSSMAVKSIEPVVLSTLNLVKDLMTVTVSIIPAARVRAASPSRR